MILKKVYLLVLLSFSFPMFGMYKIMQSLIGNTRRHQNEYVQGTQEWRTWVNSMSLPMAVLKVLPRDIQHFIVEHLIDDNPYAQQLQENGLLPLLQQAGSGHDLSVKDFNKKYIIATLNGSKSNRITIIDRVSGEQKEVSILLEPDEKIQRADLASTEIVIKTNRKLCIFNPQIAGTCPIVLVNNAIGSLAISDDGALLVYTNNQGLNSIDLKTGIHSVLLSNTSQFVSIQISANKQKVFFQQVDEDAEIQMFDITTRDIALLPLKFKPPITWRLIGDLVCILDDSQCVVYNWSKGSVMTEFSYNAGVKDFQVINNAVYIIAPRGYVYVYDIVSGEKCTEWKSIKDPGPINLLNLRMSTLHCAQMNNHELAFVDSYRQFIYVLDLARAHTLLQRLPFLTAFFLHKMNCEELKVLRALKNIPRISFIQDMITYDKPWPKEFDIFIDALRKYYGNKVAQQTYNHFIPQSQPIQRTRLALPCCTLV
jgi:hypothetical protein